MRQLRAVVAYTLRACLPPRRLVGVGLLCAAGVALALVARLAAGGDPGDAFARVAASGLFGLVLPLAALTIGDAVLAADIRAGTFAFTWLSPVRVSTIAVGRWVGGTVTACLTVVPAFAAAAAVGGRGADAPVAAVAAAAGAAGYVALFVAIGAAFRRATVVSLVVVFLVERLLGAVLSGIAQLSPSFLARAVFVGLADVPARLARRGIPTGTNALGRLAVVTAVLLVLAVAALRRLRLTGTTD